jgi:hypothetical protein
VVNRLAEPTAVHWHGIELASYPDGVPGWSGTPGGIFPGIAPGDSFTAEFTPPRAGSFMYHAQADELVQILGGLYGPLIVVEPGAMLDTAVNRLVMVGGLFRNDTAHGVVNGRLDPEPIELVAWWMVAKDGAELPAAQATERTEPLLTGPGETADFGFTPSAPGDLVLDLNSPFAFWRLAVPVRVRKAPS